MVLELIVISSYNANHSTQTVELHWIKQEIVESFESFSSDAANPTHSWNGFGTSNCLTSFVLLGWNPRPSAHSEHAEMMMIGQYDLFSRNSNSSRRKTVVENILYQIT